MEIDRQLSSNTGFRPRYLSGVIRRPVVPHATKWCPYDSSATECDVVRMAVSFWTLLEL